MKDEPFYSIPEIAKMIEIPHQTLRRYLDDHQHHLVTKKKGRSVFISENSIETIKHIRNLYINENKTKLEVDEYLTNQGLPMTITIQDESNEIVRVNVGEEIKYLREKFDEQMGIIHEQNRMIREQARIIEETKELLLKEVKNSQDWQQKRDENLAIILKGVLETKEDVAATGEAEEKHKKSLFSRLFSWFLDK